MKLSPKFDEALIYASRVHGGQLRKKTQAPYIGHLLGVTAIALEYGATETGAIGALLHDAVEDGSGLERQRDIEKRFGKEVGEIIAGCTDTDQTPKPPWRERKEHYVAHLRTASASTRLVSASDKLHNSRAIVHNPARRRRGSLGALQERQSRRALVLSGAGHRIPRAWAGRIN